MEMSAIGYAGAALAGAVAALRLKAPAMVLLSILVGAIAVTRAHHDGADVVDAIGAAALHAALVQIAYVVTLALRAALSGPPR